MRSRNDDRPHRFTEVLPREESRDDACGSCERDVGLHEGRTAREPIRSTAPDGSSRSTSAARLRASVQPPADSRLAPHRWTRSSTRFDTVIGPRAHGLKNRERTNRQRSQSRAPLNPGRGAFKCTLESDGGFASRRSVVAASRRAAATTRA